MKKFIYLLSAALFIGCCNAPAPVEKSAEIEVIGHRGGRYEFDENTLSAFIESYNKGIRSYETDVRLTADNELIIIHDATLKRTFGVDVDVEKTTRAELLQYKTLKGNPTLFADELAEFFSQKDIHYIEWEMKSKNYTPEQLKLYCDKLYNTVMPLKPENAIYIFSSFDERALMTMKELHPEAERMYITAEPVNEAVIEKAKELGLRRVGCTINKTSREAMNKAHEAGLIVNLWPGKKVEDFQLAYALGADIGCSDVPVAVMEFVNQNMQWIKLSKELK